MKRIDKLLFTGLPYSLPIGSILAFGYSRLSLSVRVLLSSGSSSVHLDSIDYKVMLLIMLSVVSLFFFVNVKRRFFDKEDNFNPLKKNVLDNSADKKKAQYHQVPTKYLSKTPNGFTIGYFYYGPRKMYVRLPFLDSPEHQLILGSPGSGKSTHLINALLYTYNFAPLNLRLRSVLAIDAKPELSRKSVVEDRDDIKIINPTVMGSFGFDIWHGLDQNSTDDH